MPLFYSAATRIYDFTPGCGSKLEIAQYDAFRNLGGFSTLDIKSGQIQEQFINDDTGHSGTAGGPDRTRVAFDWRAVLVLDFPSDIEGGLAPVAAGFVQNLLGSYRKVAVRFYMGAEEFWTENGLEIRTMRADRALLGPVETRVEQRKVIGLNAVLEGSSMLRHELGTPVPGLV